jgi:hypothetical protein
MTGITVILLERTQTGTDSFNRPTYTETQIPVANVLVAPVTPGGDEIIDQVDLSGRKASYTLAIPKGDENTWEGNKVIFFGETWQVIGMPTQGIDALIPLKWNKKVKVERIE